MDFLEILKVILIGIVEGITEWLPISSTGHMLLLDEFVKLQVNADPIANEAFINMFMVVIQLGAIMAVVLIFWKKIFPFKKVENQIKLDNKIFIMWTKVFVACLPAAIGLLIDDFLEAHFYNPITIAIMLVVYGVLFIIIENRNANKRFKIRTVNELSYKIALYIGFFQVLAMIPGTSRSGATIVGALLLGVSRVAASEFTFFLAIPTMVAASGLKLIKYGLNFSGAEIFALILGMIVAFVVSCFVIVFLMSYIKKHDFKVFGWYRIVLGALILLYFMLVPQF